MYSLGLAVVVGFWPAHVCFFRMCTSFGCASCSRTPGFSVSVSFAFAFRSDVPLVPLLLAFSFLIRSHVYFVRMCLLLPGSWPSRFCFVRICISFGCAYVSGPGAILEQSLAICVPTPLSKYQDLA